MKYKCTKECFYLGRLWKPGETRVFRKDEKLSPHFKEAKLVKIEVEVFEEEAKTFHELQKMEAEKVLEDTKTVDAGKVETDFLS